MSKPKLIITGASSGIGKGLWDIAKDDYEVVPFSARPDSRNNQFTIKREGKLRELLEPGCTLVHSGALIDSLDRNALLRANVALPLRILKLAAQKNVKKVIFIGSMSVLDQEAHPRVFNHRDHPLYAESKRLMEESIIKSRKGEFRPVIVRFSTLFRQILGEDGLSTLISNAKRLKKVEVYDVKRDFLPIKYACELLLSVCKDIDRLKDNYQDINLATGTITRLYEVAEHLQVEYDTEVVKLGGRKDPYCYEFTGVEGYGLELPKFNLFEEIDDYYQSIGD